MEVTQRGCGEPAVWRIACSLVIIMAISGPWHGQAEAEEPTPIAGEEFRTTLFGEEIYVPPRDRRSVTAVSFGLQFIPNGPSFQELLPFGALYLWRNWDDDNRRLRGTFSGVVNDVDYTIGLRDYPNWSLLFTWDNFILPFGRSEFVQGQRQRGTELEWSYAFAGAGIGYRLPIHPFRQDSAVNISLTYEAGYRWFAGTGHTSADYGVPKDTYEGRIHFRIRADSLKRNLMELPHEGFTMGGDFVHGRRAKWDQWGGPPFATPDFKQERTYLQGSAYALMATGLPFIESDKHRLLTSIHGGIGKDLDRFSAFRLASRPTGYEWEAISLPMIHGVAFNELFPTRYAVANLQYRYEALFFFYPYVEATWGLVERPVFTNNAETAIKSVTDSLPTLGGGLVTGAPFKSQLELNYTYNFGIYRDPGGAPPTKGGHGLILFWSKEIGSSS